ncbi:hypothetical protein TthHB5008_08760 [Thermus thermophilus]|uniref:hypothetical protein n=1 Tax=Thermus thermophilus TaxID=274 RepID=UPI001AF90753|nr:hypothetical protein [Thermus thermophilus]BCP97775.1 hypothetical protein TthHB5002_08780 [Thermus thermophilus]BCQ00106.1 hypothetical protein TthHB5008_08760 [Thermus thermophilus]
MPRRGRGEGTIVRRPDGRWMGQIMVGYGPDGKPRRLTVYGKTRQEVAAKLAELAAQRHKGLLPEPTETSLREWASRWLERKGREVRPKTLTLYRDELAYAIPSLKDPRAPDPLGRMRLQEVKPAHVRAVLDALTERGLSVRTVKKVRERLHALFEEALTQNLHLFTAGMSMLGDHLKRATGFPSYEGCHETSSPIPTLDHPGPHANPPPAGILEGPVVPFPHRSRQG